MLLNTCLPSMTNMLLSTPTRPLTILFLCVNHITDCLINELGFHNLLGNRTYTPTTLPKEEIMDNHRSVLCSFGMSTNDEELTGSPITLLDSEITQVSFQTALYCWVCQMLLETSFQIINMYSIGVQNRASELL
jgi:hypothetical protein